MLCQSSSQGKEAIINEVLIFNKQRT